MTYIEPSPISASDKVVLQLIKDVDEANSLISRDEFVDRLPGRDPVAGVTRMTIRTIDNSNKKIPKKYRCRFECPFDIARRDRPPIFDLYEKALFKILSVTPF